MSLQEILEYAIKHDCKFNGLFFKHRYNGEKFVVLDAEKELFQTIGCDNLKTLKDLEYEYEDESLFVICCD